MGEKLGGLVCDSCRIFCGYANEQALKRWLVVPVTKDHIAHYCSEKCREAGWKDRKEIADAAFRAECHQADKCL